MHDAVWIFAQCCSKPNPSEKNPNTISCCCSTSYFSGVLAMGKLKIESSYLPHQPTNKHSVSEKFSDIVLNKCFQHVAAFIFRNLSTCLLRTTLF